MIESKERSNIFQENCELITENINELIIIINQMGEIESINNLPLIKSLGYKSDDLIGNSWLNYVHNEDLEIAINSLENCTESKPFVQELRLKHAKGNYKNFKFYAKLTKDFNKPKVFLIILKPEQRLKISEEFYKTLLDGIINGVWVTNRDDKIYFTNKGMGNIAGITADQIVDTNVLKDFPESTLEYFRSYYLKAKESLKPVYYNSVPVKTPGGRQSYQSGWLIPRIKEGIYDGIICTVEDVTERIEYEQELKESKAELVKFNIELEQKVEERTSALKESEEKFRTITEQSLMGIAILQDDRFRYVNKQIADIFGYEPEEMKNWEKFEYAKLIHPDDREMALEQARRKQLGLPGAVIHYQFRGMTKQGKMKWIEIYSSSINYREGIADLITSIDITKKKLAEEKFKTISDQSLVGIVIAQDGIIKYANKQMEQLSGYSIEEMKNWKTGEFLKIIHPDYRNLVSGQSQKKQRGLSGVMDQYQFMGIKKSGEIIWVDDYSKTITYEGKPAILSILIDITEKKEAEQNLKESEQKYRTMIDSISDIIFEIDLDGKITYLSPQSLDMIGYRPEELINQNAFRFIHHDDQEEVLNNQKHVINSGEIGSVEFRARHKKGHYITVSSRGQLIEKNDKKKIVGLFRDITERKKIEEEVNQEREKAEIYLNLVNVIIVALDIDGNISLINKKGNDILGYTDGELIHKNWFQNCLPLQDRERVQNYFKKLMKGKTEIPPFYENSVITKNGDEKLIAWSTILFRDSNGNITGLLSSGEDITERKKAERKLKESEERLKHLVSSSPTAIYTAKASGEKRITFISENIRDITGYDSKEFLENSEFWISKIHPEDKDLVLKRLKRISKVEKLGFEYRFKFRDEIYHWIRDDVKLIKDEKGEPIEFIGSWADITFNKRIEEKIQYQAKLVDDISDAIISTDLKFNIISWNKAAESIYGWKLNEVIRKNLREIIPIKYQDDDENSVIEKFFEEGVWKGEVIQKRKDGISLNILSSVSMIKDITGKPIGIVAINRDITERKKAEEKLKKSEKELVKKNLEIQTIFNTIPAMLNIVDREYNVIDISDEFAKVFHNGKKENVIGRKCYQAHKQRDSICPNCSVKKVFELGKIETRFSTPEEEKLTGKVLKIYAAPIKNDDGNISSVIEAIMDVTDIKKAEEKLRESEKRLTDLIEAVPVGISITSPEGKIEECNSSACQIFGYNSKENFVKNPVMNYYYDPDDRDRFIELLEKGLVRDYETQFIRKDGSIFWGSLTSIAHKMGDQNYYINSFQDVTERKLAEIKIQESEAELAAIYDYTPIALLLVDNERRIRKINKYTLKFTDCKEEDLFGIHGGEALRCLYSIKDPRGCGFSEYCQDCIIRNTILDTFETKIPHINVEATLYLLPGVDIDKVHLLISTVPLNFYGEDQVLISLIDITDRMNAEQKLKESEERYRNISNQYKMLLESITDAVYALNRDWEYILVNKNAEKIVNMPIGDLLGHKISEVFPGIENTPFFKVYETVMNTGKAERVINSYTLPNGHTGFYEVSVYPIREGILCIGKDVTEEKEIEQKLKESEEKFRTIAEQSSLGMIIQQDGFIKFANLAVSDIIEYPLEEIHKWTAEDTLKFIYKEDLQLIIEKLKQRQNGDFKSINHYECRAITESGKIKWIDVYTKPIIYHGKNAVLSTFIDITEKKKVEEELKEISTLKSDLLSRTSHELKTPLVSIKGYADLLLTQHYEELDFYTISVLHEIKQGCSRLESLIKDLLKTSKLESGEIELIKAKEDLTFLIRFCVRDLKGLVETRNHELILDIKDEMITYFEKEKIYEVLMNLISNAIKYTPKNGRITIRSEIQNGNYVISVQDTGIGLTGEEKAKIFKKFGKVERYGQGLDVVSEGSGLGLYISKKIIELHEGNIWVESEGRKRGSIFKFSLPIIKN